MMPRRVPASARRTCFCWYGREEVDHTVHGLGGIDRVQGRHHQVAGLRGLDRGAHGLGVTHLTDQDHVGVLAEGRAQGDEEVHRVVADLPLVDRRHLVAVEDLDRVLDGHDVHGLGLVDVVDHGRERRRLARPRGAGHQDEAAVLVGDRAHGVRQPDLFERGPAEAELAQHHADRVALTEDVDAEPADVGDRVGEVHLAGVVELLLAVLGDDPVGDRLGLDARERVAVEPRQALGQSDHRRRPHLDVQVGALTGDELFEPSVELRHDGCAVR